MPEVKIELANYIKTMSGNVLGFNIDDDKLINELNRNNNIIECNLLSDKNSNIKGKGKSKIVNIKKIKKQFKKKKIDYIISDVEAIDSYLKTFIKDSIYINKNMIYIYTIKGYDYTNIVNRYKRYKIDIKINECSDGYIIVLNVGNKKTNYFKDKWYYIIDTLVNFVDLIGDVMAS